MFFRLASWELALIVAAIVLGFAALGLLIGRQLRKHSETLREPVGAVQGALLALVGLILAFGLTMAVGRYDSRRSAVVDEANAIGTTYLRAQTLGEPVRSRSLDLLEQYTDTSLRLSHEVPTTPAFRTTVAEGGVIQRRLWRLASEALSEAPAASAPRLYVETLNEMIDMQTVRVAELNNRVPGAVLVLEVFGAAVALGLLALYMAMLGQRPDHRASRRGARDASAPGHVRPRPSHPWPDQRPRQAARCVACVDGASAGRYRAWRLAAEPGQRFEVGAVLRGIVGVVAGR